MNPEKIFKEEAKRPVLDFSDFIEGHPDTLQVIEESRRIDAKRHSLDDPSNQNRENISFHDYPKRSDINGYLGSGHEKAAYVVDEEFVVKVQNVKEQDGKFVTSTRGQIDALSKGIGVDGLEQIISYDEELGVIITRKAPGTPVSRIPTNKLIAMIKKEHVEKLTHTLAFLTDENLEFDNIENVLFDTDKGFTIIDYRKPLNQLNDSKIVDHYKRELAERQTTEAFLKIVLSLKRVEQKGVFNEIGEPESYHKNRLGHRAVRALIKLRT